MSTTPATQTPSQPQQPRNTPPSSGRDRRPPSSRGIGKQNSKSEILGGGSGGGAATGKKKEGKERREREKSERKEDETEERGTPVPLTYALFTQDQLNELRGADIEDGVNKIAQFLSFTTWREDLQTNILVSFHYSNYIFAKDNNFTPSQIGAFCSIMKTILDRSVEKALSLNESIALFKKLLLGHFSPTVDREKDPEPGGWEIFGAREVKLASKWAMTGLFQHYRLHTHVLTTDQDREDTEITLTVEYPPIPPTPPQPPTPQPTDPEQQPQPQAGLPTSQSTTFQAAQPPAEEGASPESGGKELVETERWWPPPLSESVTLEEYEAEQERQRERDEQMRIEEEKRRKEEEDAAANPFAVLSPDQIKHIAVDAVSAAMAAVTAEVEKAMEEQRGKFMSGVAKVVG
ncbi:hypothetical protein HDV00_010742 [Rhizophlyctis rosea]|nr:hypothetical protein HDV00_010742 [Rhizophlyctis rosea]